MHDSDQISKITNLGAIKIQIIWFGYGKAIMEFQAMKHLLTLLTAAAVFVPVQLNAAGSSGNLDFTANVTSECQISVDGTGTLQYVNSTQLSTEGSGQRATAEITTNVGDSFAFSAPPPTAWTSANIGDYTFKTITTLVNIGGNSVTDVDNISGQLLSTGLTTASVGLQVDRNDGIFSPDTYNVQMNITCA